MRPIWLAGDRICDNTKFLRLTAVAREAVNHRATPPECALGGDPRDTVSDAARTATGGVRETGMRPRHGADRRRGSAKLQVFVVPAGDLREERACRSAPATASCSARCSRAPGRCWRRRGRSMWCWFEGGGLAAIVKGVRSSLLKFRKVSAVNCFSHHWGAFKRVF